MAKKSASTTNAALFLNKKKLRPPAGEINWPLRLEIANYYLQHKPRYCDLADKFHISPDQARRIGQQAMKLKQHVHQSGELPLSNVCSQNVLL
jgi:hypothetical protein